MSAKSSKSSPGVCFICNGKLSSTQNRYPSSLYSETMIKFLHFHKLTTGINQHTTLQQPVNYYTELLKNSNLVTYCDTCAEKINDITAAMEQLDAVGHQLNKLQMDISTKLRSSLGTRSQLNQHRKRFAEELESRLAASAMTATFNPRSSRFISCELIRKIAPSQVNAKHNLSAAYVKLIRLEQSHIVFGNHDQYTQVKEESVHELPAPVAMEPEDDFELETAHTQLISDCSIGASDDDEYYASIESVKATRKRITQTSKPTSENLKCQYPDCNAIKISVIRLRNHVRESHSDGAPDPFLCYLCGAHFGTNQLEMSQHVIYHNNYKTDKHEFSCSFCSKTYKQHKSLLHHVQIKHSNALASTTSSELICKYCLKPFASVNKLWAHVRRKHVKPKVVEIFNGDERIKERIFMCSFCSTSFNVLCSLRKHLAKMHTLEILFSRVDVISDPELQQMRTLIKEESQTSIAADDKVEQDHVTNDVGTEHRNDRNLSENKLKELTQLILEEFSKPCQYLGCTFVGSSRTNLEAHVKEQHISDGELISKYICVNCGLKFPSNTSEDKQIIGQHLNMHTKEETRYTCKFCSKDFRLILSLHKHVREHHSSVYKELLAEVNNCTTETVQDNNNLFQCKFCTMSFSYKNLWTHLNTRHAKILVHKKSKHEYTQPRNFKCNFCDLSSERLNSIFKHQRVYHLRQVIVNFDSVEIPKGSSESSNSTQPTEKDQFICEHCGKSFKTNRAVRVHAKKHRELFPCTLCTSVFKAEHSFKIHQARHHATELNLSDYKCDQCDKVLSSPDYLRYHIRVCHNKEYQYECQQCPKKFFFHNQLKRHMFVHTNERHLLCPHCDQTFYLQHKLTLHIRTHTGEKPFVCKHCGKGFTRRSTWRRHEPTHELARPFPCSLCGVRFPTMNNLRGHLVSHHKNKGLGDGIKPTRKSKYNPMEEDNETIIS